MTVSQAENSMRIEAAAWASENGITFEFDNSVGIDVTNPTQPILMWAFSESGRVRMSSSLVEVTGECRGTILMPATPDEGTSFPMQEHLDLVESLLDTFRDREFGGALVVKHSRMQVDGLRGSMRAVTAIVSWELYLNHELPGTIYSPTPSGGARQAYQTFRALWGTLVEPTLSVDSYFDGTPGLAISLPACICSYSILQGNALEINSSRGLGRVDVDLHYLLGSGVQGMQSDTDLIVQSFDSVSAGRVVFETPRVTRLGRTSEETWHVNVRLPFTFKDISS